MLRDSLVASTLTKVSIGDKMCHMGKMHHMKMILPMSNFTAISLTEDERTTLETFCRRRKVDALGWNWVRAEQSEQRTEGACFRRAYHA